MFNITKKMSGKCVKFLFHLDDCKCSCFFAEILAVDESIMEAETVLSIIERDMSYFAFVFAKVVLVRKINEV